MEEGFIKINEKMEEGFRKINEKVHEMDTRLKSVEMKIADQRRDSYFMDFQYEDEGRVYETGGGSNARGDNGMEETPAEETRDAPAPVPAEETRDAPAPVPAEETRDAPAPVPEETTDVPVPAVETTNAPTPVPAETPEPPAKKPRYKICMRKSAEAKRTAELIRNRRKGKPSRHISTPYENDAPGERKKREAAKKK
ncbi:myrosinase-binding protein 2-like [Eutrema salsugineum]|uniref:myrosinase-binding protein 2-like n=1 Tax=Eutrema salsugineum TaxID=72664 RepID=UPI000CED5695|nr:myrosinase-binding protein 2-like [Eutrema salsugineum]